MENKYPEWIDEYAKSFHNGLKNMMPCSWGPIDVYVLLSALNGTLNNKVNEAVKKAKEYSIEDIAKCFSSLSSLRIAFYYLIAEYQFAELKNKEQVKENIKFFLKLLQYMTKEDTFAYKSNIAHTKKEIDKIVDSVKWQEGNPEIAKELGKLYTSLASLAFVLFRDFFPQESHEIYGPYKVNNNTFIIKEFPKINPKELWPNIEGLKHKNVKIYQIFKDIEFSCELIGMHSLYKGSPINNLIKYAVLVDEKYYDIQGIKELNNHFSELATKNSIIYDGMSKQDINKKGVEWLCYLFNDFFKLAGMDWKPNKEMLKAIENKDIPARYESEDFPSFEEYSNSPDFEVYWLKDLYK